MTQQPQAGTGHIFPPGEQGDVRSRCRYFFSSGTSIFGISVVSLFGITFLWAKVFAWSWCDPGHVSTAMQPRTEQTTSQEASLNILSPGERGFCPSPMGWGC